MRIVAFVESYAECTIDEKERERKMHKANETCCPNRCDSLNYFHRHCYCCWAEA